MARKVIGAKGSTRRHRFLFVPILLAACTALFVVAGAQAVHDTGSFELDGNAVTTVSHDWDQVCYQATSDSRCGTTTSAGAVAASWTSDKLETSTDVFTNDPNATIFTGGGSKDPQDISSWAWKDGAGGLPDKDNLSHSFAARYSLTATNNSPPGTTNCPNGTGAGSNPPVAFDSTKKCEVLFFGSDRFDNSGDAQQGFWFFQNPIGLGTNAVGGGKGFTGVHAPGDLLIISDFSNGGTTSTISVYKWDPTVNGNLRLLAQASNANCNTAGGADAFCGLVNSSAITMPWPFLDKSGTPNNGALNGEFYEGGVNLSLLGLGNECFSSVASETRSSTSTTATLKDFVLGTFGKCDTTLTTTPTLGDGTTTIPGTGTSITTAGSIQVKDSASLVVSGGAASSWSGTLKFFLCKVATTSDTCASGGTQIGSTLNVSNNTTQPIVSDAATITSAANGTTGAPGRYCWRGEFTSATSGVPSKNDSSATECFIVNPVQPNLTTTAGGTVEIGNPVTDTAHLTGTANQPGTPVINPTTAGGPAGGTITFKLYGPNDATCANAPVHTSSAVSVSGDNDYTDSYTPTAAGTYRWVASYTGDNPNTLSKSGACNDANESVVVSPKQPTISTQVNHEEDVIPGTQLSDTATLGNLATPSNGVQGTIVFTAYGPEADASTCNTIAYTSTITVSGNGPYNSADGSGGLFQPILPGHYNWIASYTPATGDVNNLPVSGTCGDAHEGSVVIQLQPTISTAQTVTLKDAATISVASGGAGNLAGTVRFRLYNNATCDPGLNNVNLVYDSRDQHPSDIAVSGSGSFPQSVTVNSDTTTFTTSQPTLSWLVEYTSSNAGHNNVTSSCNTENASLSITNG